MIKKLLSSIRLSFVVLSLLTVSFSIVSLPVIAYTNGLSASVVVGQPDFTTLSNGTTQSKVKSPVYGVFSDGTRLFVVDQGNSRVLIYNSIPTTNGANADLVLGHADFTTTGQGALDASGMRSPSGVHYDGSKLFVADELRNRILIWNSLPTSNNQAANVVLGQPNFGDVTNRTTQNGMWVPKAVFSDGTHLIVTECSNNRILIWNSIPTTDYQNADVVVGQSDFTTATTSIGQNKLSCPQAAVIADGKLIVADQGYRRVMIWNTIPTTNGVNADVVLGQPDFVSNTANNGGVDASSISQPTGISVDQYGRLFLVDAANNRVLSWTSIPTTNNAEADRVIGQADFTTTSAAQGQSTLNVPLMVSATGTQLFVGQYTGNNVLIFNNLDIPTPTPTPTASAGQSTNSSNSSSPSGPPACSDSAPSSAPDLFQVNASHNTATLYFSPAGNPHNYYYLAYGYSENDERFGAQLDTGHTDGVKDFTVEQLAPNTTYYFKIRGGNGCMPGQWSRPLKVKTDSVKSRTELVYYAYYDVIRRVVKLLSI